MKVIQTLTSDLAELENKIADDILAISAELRPFPKDRDDEKLEAALRSLMSSRRKLSRFLKLSLRGLEAPDVVAALPVRKIRETRRLVNSSKRLVRLWGRFEAAIHAQMEASQRELMGPDIAPQREVRVMDHVIEMFLEAMHRVANPTAHQQDDEANTYGCHRDIPLPMTNFTSMIGAAHRICLAQRKPRPLKFLDVGSGGGTKVLAATTCFDQCHGLEYEESTVETGTRLLELLAPETCKLMHGDALKFDGYADYDVIYFYRPMANFSKLVEMEDRIISQVKPGTLIVAAGGLYATELEEKDVHEVVYQIYVTGMSKSEADALGQAAEMMGPTVSGYGRRDYRLGYWAPLFDVSAQNGYFV